MSSVQSDFKISSSASHGVPANGPPRPPRRRTTHLKEIPPTADLRETLRTRCHHVAADLSKTEPLTQARLETTARQILADLDQPEGYLGWTMVILSSEFWRDQVAAVPPSRRLLLLPHCLKHAEGCPADYDQFGLDCEKCGACSIADFREQAEKLGYKVLVAEGSPIVMKIIVGGYIDAIVGVACLNVLEKAFDKVLLAGIPSMAVPLHSSDCRNTSVDENWVEEMIQNRPPLVSEIATKRTPTYLHLLRTARQLFEPEQLERLAPRMRSQGASDPLADPIGATEAIGHDFLALGGKYARPFITLAAYDALTGALCTQTEDHTDALPDKVRRVALSIETFHKASLVHDDIEDSDDYRYGQPTLHREYGMATAINAGDYLIGLGYRLVSGEIQSLGAETAGDILHLLADAHLRLSEGQGAELIWRDARDKALTPLDALKIYALKTAPAFEAALLCGLRCAGPLEEYQTPLKQFSQHLGIAFQILNDLKDWQGDDDNKLAKGLDTLGGRPTILWALALETLDEERREELFRLMQSDEDQRERLARVEAIYRTAGVFEKTHQLVDKYQQRAERIVNELQPESLRRLLYYLLDTVLERPAEVSPVMVMPVLPGG